MEGGIFSIGRNLQRYRELGRELGRIGALPKKKSRDRQIEDLRGQQRRLVLKMFIGGGILATGTVIGVTGAISLFGDDEVDGNSLPNAQPPLQVAKRTLIDTEVPEDKKVKNLTRIEQKEITGASDFEKMLVLQKEWRALSIKAASLFMGADPRVEQLLAFMDSNAFYSIPVGLVVTRQVAIDDPTIFTKQAQNPHSFEIVYMPEEFSRYYPASIVTEDGPTLRVIAEFKILQWLGLMLLHELSHVEDIRVRHEDPRDKKQWFDGEIKAHSFEMNLLKFVDPDAYKFLIEKGTPLYLSGNRESLVQFIEKLYRLEPVMVSEREKSLFISSCVIAIAFEEAKKRGADNSGLVSVYRDVAKKYGNLDL